MTAVHVFKRFCVPLTNSCCKKKLTNSQVRFSATLGRSARFAPAIIKVRHLGLGTTTKEFDESGQQITGPITKVHAAELVLHLNNEERKLLLTALQEYESNKIKEEFEGMVYVISPKKSFYYCKDYNLKKCTKYF